MSYTPEQRALLRRTALATPIGSPVSAANSNAVLAVLDELDAKERALAQLQSQLEEAVEQRDAAKEELAGARREKPSRRFTLHVNVEGDTLRDLKVMAREVLDTVQQRLEAGERIDLTIGGPDAGAYASLVEDAEQTHERYHQQLDAYLEAVGT